jgi:HSP20 family molecular chaperone IbpA
MSNLGGVVVFNKQKFIIAIVCVSVGWFIGYEMGKAHEQKVLRQKSQSIFNIAPFLFSTPFDSFNNQEKEEREESAPWWSQFFLSMRNFKGKIIDNGMSVFGGGDTGDFKTHEDADFVYFEYEMEKISKDSLNVRVENNMVIIEGNETKEAFGATVSSSFHRAFPAPDNVDVDKVQMDYLNNKLIVKFPKLKK